ncbi:MAG: hypothetical protein QXJ48_01515 [Candidatus Korarchaeum sp.]
MIKVAIEIKLNSHYREGLDQVLILRNLCDLSPVLVHITDGFSRREIEALRRIYEREGFPTIIADLKSEEVSGGKSFDLNDFILTGKLGKVYLDLMIADSRLSEVIDRLWFGDKARREYLLSRVLKDTGLTESYDFVILDTIPFYD